MDSDLSGTTYRVARPHICRRFESFQACSPAPSHRFPEYVIQEKSPNLRFRYY